MIRFFVIVLIIFIIACDTQHKEVVEEYTTTVVEDMFVPFHGGFSGNDHYAMLTGTQEVIQFHGNEAREMNLRFSQGDSIVVVKKTRESSFAFGGEWKSYTVRKVGDSK